MRKKHYLSYYLWLLFLFLILSLGVWVFAQGTTIAWTPWYEKLGKPILGQLMRVLKG